jgi:dTDP-4-dehydrorhamnose 3,5-epimerase
MEWKIDDREEGIAGVMVKEKGKNVDSRGWLSELWRGDDDIPMVPVMAYLSCTKPRTVRGPHEHRHQTDLFIFISGVWAIRLWDKREESQTYGVMRTIRVFDAESIVMVMVPPGVVHAYGNMGLYSDGMVINLPDGLYRGWGKVEEVDEIRHEGNAEYDIGSMTYPGA